MKTFRIYYTNSNEFGTSMKEIKAYSKFDAANVFKEENMFCHIVEIIEA